MCEVSFLGGVCTLSCLFQTRDLGFSAERIGAVCGRMPSTVFPFGCAVAIAVTRDLGLSSGLPVRLRFQLATRGFVSYTFRYVDVMIGGMYGPEGDLMCMGPKADFY